MSRCDHSGGNITPYGEVCLDCGRYIHEKDYEKSLHKDVDRLLEEARNRRLANLEEQKLELEKSSRYDLNNDGDPGNKK